MATSCSVCREVQAQRFRPDVRPTRMPSSSLMPAADPAPPSSNAARESCLPAYGNALPAQHSSEESPPCRCDVVHSAVRHAPWSNLPFFSCWQGCWLTDCQLERSDQILPASHLAS